VLGSQLGETLVTAEYPGLGDIMDRAVTVILAVAVAAGAIETFYEHPTYGRGLEALLTVVRLGEAL